MSKEQAERIAELEAQNEELRTAIREMDERMRRLVAPYVTNEVYQAISDLGGVLAGERRVVTMMFTDIRRSTELSERLPPTDFIRLLNHYLGDMVDIINAWQGNILEFVGDAIVAVFGAPRPDDDAAFQAVACAVAMQRRMEAINEWNLEQGYPPLEMGIGIHTGEAILGSIGNEVRMKYDAVGRNMNLAARVEGYTKGGQILVTAETLEAAGDRVVVREGGDRWVRPRGISGEVLIHDVIGFGSLRIPDVAKG